ncbi:MAG: hypothetical protein PUG43_00810 [Clostridiales bacterium]|nr:hypothetical protein [Clostridiales bacterium]MDD7347076.1 hypothetical protein [Clostridiales bacterium]MDY4060302.1 hypothetical protein [Anaerovoracaceae bacterium]
MKRLTSCIKRIGRYAKKLITDKEFWAYTFIFWGLMFGIYLYLIYAGMAKAPQFTYAEF